MFASHARTMLGPGVASRQSLALVGNSHIVTMFDGYQRLARHLSDSLELTFVAQDGQSIGYAVCTSAGIRRLHPRGGVVELVGDLDATDIFVMWLGSQMNIRGLLLSGSDFDVMLPADGDRPIAPETELIPCAVVDDMVRHSLDSDEDLSKLIERGQGRGANVWLMAPPHALPDAAVRERLGNESHFAKRLGEAGLSPTDVRIVPGPVRVRLRTILLGAYQAFAEKHGCGFSPPPEQVADANGMLLPAYWGEDITHAGPAYGAAYLEELIGIAGGGCG